MSNVEHSDRLALDRFPKLTKTGLLLWSLALSATGLFGQGIAATPSSLHFTGSVRSPAFPQTIIVRRISDDLPFRFRVTSNVPWLTTSVPLQNGVPLMQVIVQPDFSGVNPGTLEGSLTITPESIAEAPITVPVTALVSGPALTVSLSTVTFDVAPGFGTAVSEEIFVRSLSGPQASFRLEIDYDGPVTGWLTSSAMSGSTGTSNQSFALRATGSSQLTAGTHSARVIVSAPGFSPVTIAVLLQVSAQGSLSTDVPSLSLKLAQAGAPGTRLLRVTTTRGGTTSFTVDPSPGTPWLTVAKRTGTTPETVVVSLNPGSLPSATYSGFLSIASPTTPVPLLVRVTMTVGSPEEPLQTLSYSPTSLRFVSDLGAPSAIPPPQSLQLRLSPALPPQSMFLTLDFDGENRNWLSAVGTQVPGALEVRVYPLSTRGTYTARIRIQVLGALTNPDIEIPITLVVQGPAPRVFVSPSESLRFVPSGNAPARDQILQLSSLEPVPYEITTTSSLLTLLNARGTTPGTVTVRAKTSGTFAGTYLEEMFLDAPLAANHRSRLTALVTVGAASPGFGVSPRTLAFSAEQEAAPSEAQSFTVLDYGGASNFAVRLQASQPWVTFATSIGRTGTPISVRVNPAGVAVGTHQAVISISILSDLLVAELPVTLTVSPAQTPMVNGWTNAASGRAGPLAPGMLFTLAGINLGPRTGLAATATGGRYATTLSGVRVLLDGIPAPILYTSATQINAAVPYALSGRVSAQLLVESSGRRSPAVTIRLDDTAPGIFTTDGAQAAALNEDGSVNSVANPARPGSVVVLYLTGEGATSPAGTDGELVPASNLRRPLGAVRVRVNQVELPSAEILYAGSAPGLIAGLMQVNLRLPADLPANASTPVQVVVGSAASPAGVTLAVR